MALDRLIPTSYYAKTLVGMPNFLVGLAQEVQDLLTVHSTIPSEVQYLADIRHWVLIQMAIALHFEHQQDQTRPRLTPKSLLTALDGTGIASRNTVQAFLRELARVQLTDMPAAKTIRQHAPQVSVKSEKLIEIYLDIHLRALDTIDGGDRHRVFRATPAMVPALQSRFARRICVSPAWYDPPASVKCFTGSASGSSILHDLVLGSQTRVSTSVKWDRSQIGMSDFAGADADGRIWVGPVSATKLAQTYKVSSAHIARILTKANALGVMGWQKPRRGGECWLSVPLAQSYMAWQAEKLAALSVAFGETCAAWQQDHD